MEENIRYLIHNPNRHEELNKKIAKEYFDSNNVIFYYYAKIYY